VIRLSKEFKSYAPNELFVKHASKLLEKKMVTEVAQPNEVARALETA
jgi:hypothetical protein